MENHESNLMVEILNTLHLRLQALITLPTLLIALGNIVVVVSGPLCVYYKRAKLTGGSRITTSIFHALFK
jgi:hypothetical protein